MLPKGHSVGNRDYSSSTNVVVNCELEILQVNQLLGRQLKLILKMKKGLFIRSRCRKWRQKVKVKRQQQQKCCNNLQMHDIFHGIMRGCQKSLQFFFYLCDEITPLKRLIEYMYKYKRKMRKIGIIVAVQFAVFKLAIQYLQIQIEAGAQMQEQCFSEVHMQNGTTVQHIPA